MIEGSIKEVAEGNCAAERASNSIAAVVAGIKEIAEFSKDLKVMVQDQSEAMRHPQDSVTPSPDRRTRNLPDWKLRRLLSRSSASDHAVPALTDIISKSLLYIFWRRCITVSIANWTSC